MDQYVYSGNLLYTASEGMRMPDNFLVPHHPRFSFRLFTPDDLHELRALYSHPESVRYMSPDGRPWTDADLLHSVAAWRNEFFRVGYTKWRVETPDGAFIGRAGISAMPDNPMEAELGYSVLRQEWGKGIATELATIVRDWAWQRTTLPYLIGVTRLGNTASQRVLIKIGMAGTGRRELQGSLCEFFRIDRPNMR